MSHEWVHGKVAELLGFSEDASVEFIVMAGKIYIIVSGNLLLVAQKAKSSESMYKSLIDFGFPTTGATSSFANDLFERYSKFYAPSKVN